MELLPAGGQQLDVCGTHSSHSIKTSTHDVPLEPSWTVSPDGNNLEVFNCFQGRLWLQLTRAPERRSDERSWRRPVRLADSRCSSTTMRRDGISIQPPSEGELHANSRPCRSGAGWARRAAVLRVVPVGDSRRQTCPSQNISNPKMWKSRQEEPKVA